MKIFVPLFKIFAFLVLFVSQSAMSAGHVGFASGNQFQSVSARGRLTVTCPKSKTDPTPVTVTHSCQRDGLRPQNSDYFVGPKIDADSVKLRSIKASGFVEEVEKSYDGSKGKSPGAINLGLDYFFSRPFLGDGVNRITYVLEKNHKVVARGEFTATVTRLPFATCEDRSVQSNDITNCQFSWDICDEYFENENYCQ